MMVDEKDRECKQHWSKKNGYKILVGKCDGKRQLGRTRRRWKYNIKTDLYNRCKFMNWIHVAQNRVKCLALLNMVINLLVL